MGYFRRFAPFALMLGLCTIVLGAPSVALGDDERNNSNFRAKLLGVNETPSNSTDGTGTLTLHINGSGDTATIEYTLTFADLRAPAAVAHVHFAQSKVAGGVMFFLCGGPRPACPSGTSGTVTVSGTVTAADVIGPVPQGIDLGQMGRVVRAIRDGAAYGNIHSSKFPGGEIRGQLVRARDD